MTFLVLIVSIGLSFAMVRPVYPPAGQLVANRPTYLGQWLRPPDITIGGVQVPTSGSAVRLVPPRIVAMNNDRK